MALDIRTKIIITGTITAMALVYREPPVLALLCLISILLLFLFRTPVILYRRTLIYLFFMYIALIALQSVFVRSGTVLFGVGGIALLTTDGLMYGMSVTLRFVVFITAGMILIGCKRTELITALVKLRMPYEIVMMIQIGMRFVPLLTAELQDTLRAIQLRGVDLRKVYKKKVIKVYLGIFLPTVYMIWRKAEKMALLLELRGFRKYPDRTYYRKLTMGRQDYAALAGLALFSGAFIYAAAVFL